MKRFLLTLAVLMASITAAFAAVLSGSCGANVTYTLDTETGVLKIEGTGAMRSYSDRSLNGVYVTTALWGDYYQTLKSVTIYQGLTSIGDNAFKDSGISTLYGLGVNPPSGTCSLLDADSGSVDRYLIHM